MHKQSYIRLANAIQQIILQHQVRSNRMVPLGYWTIGRLLSLANVFFEKNLEHLLKNLSQSLQQANICEWSTRQLNKCLLFYKNWPNKEDIQAGLSWSHYQLLSKIRNKEARDFYLEKILREHWSCQTLRRQISSRFFERTRLPEMNPADILKDHYVLDFAALPATFNEQELEEQLLAQLEYTLLEMGSAISFVARQKRITTFTGKQFFVDLVFYHTQLKSFLLVELKKGELSHRDLGQMDAYLRLYDQLVFPPADHPSIGLILCTFIDPSLRQYSLLNDHPRIFAATYSPSPITTKPKH